MVNEKESHPLMFQLPHPQTPQLQNTETQGRVVREQSTTPFRAYD
jgi:hypothetical protein